ncbi:MAG: endonuclease V [Rhodothermaceae bacterium]|nr:endonuclease V [Rhodothermaceae bacterium]
MTLPPPLHRWDVSPKEAIGIQKALAAKVRTETLEHPVRHIAGVDVSIRGDRFQTAIAVISYPDLELVEKVTFQGDVPFPYIPGLLSFREMPAILPALAQLNTVPEVFMTDSQGLAHPRRFGLACHLGVWLGRPCFGVAKTRFIGTHAPLGMNKGDLVDLVDKEQVIGSVVRTRSNVKPVYVSIGHRITQLEAIELTLGSTTKYKIPEPTRLAHKFSKIL